jgi:hypothetical protein
MDKIFQCSLLGSYALSSQFKVPTSNIYPLSNKSFLQWKFFQELPLFSPNTHYV